MTPVQLPSSLIYTCSHPYSSGWWLRDDLYQWLRISVGRGNQAGSWIENQDWMWTYRFYDDTIRDNLLLFNDAKHALLFKLTWGGR